jgi:hypothetical protein
MHEGNGAPAPLNPGLVFAMVQVQQNTAALKAATLEFVPNADRVSPPQSAAFAMTMLTTTASGDAYTLAELTAMYSDAGFGGITVHPIPMSPHTIVMGVA